MRVALSEINQSSSPLGSETPWLKRLFDSGMRRGELLSLRLEDLDLEKGRCIIRGKTGQRTAIFSELCKATISEYWQNYRIFQDTKPSSAFWLTPEGTPLSDGGFGMVIRRIEEASGVDFHAHKLRHTYASMLARKVDLPKLVFLIKLL